MNTLDVLLVLRERLEIARNKNNHESADELMIIFDRLTEISYGLANPDLTRLLVDLTDAAHDTLMNESWKSTIPTVETIQAVFTPSSEAS